MARLAIILTTVVLQIFVNLPAFAEWQFVRGGAKDIGVGADGTVWVIGTNDVFGGHDIYRWTGNGWEKKSGGGVRIAVGSSSNIWVVNDKNEIYQWTGTGWEKKPGGAKDIGVGADGTVGVIGTKVCIEPGTGFSLYSWTGTGWTQQNSTCGRHVDVGNASNVWMVQSGGSIFTWK